MSNPTALVQKLWHYGNILRDDGLSYGDYVEQLTFLLFLKMADEQARPPFNKPSPIPKGKDDDVRWHGAAAEKEQPQVDPQGAARQRRRFGVPPKGNANFAWVQHFIHHRPPR